MPLPEPTHTHSHPESILGGSLGKTANGLHTGSRTSSETPFDYVSAAEATKDLPATDARTACIPFPDHRMSRGLTISGFICVSSIPRFPRGCSFIKAYKQGYMPQNQIDSFSWDNKIRARDDSRSWQRVSRNSLMPTVMTAPRPDDGAGGDILHWDDHRLLTIMEARRAQVFPDHEVLIGSLNEQWKIVGNSVARCVALALGVSLRTAWLANTTRQYVSADHKTKSLPSIASTATARNGWSTQSMLNRFTTALNAPKALVSAITDTIREPLTDRVHYISRKTDNEPLDYVNSVKVCETEVGHLSVATIDEVKMKPQTLFISLP